MNSQQILRLIAVGVLGIALMACSSDAATPASTANNASVATLGPRASSDVDAGNADPSIAPSTVVADCGNACTLRQVATSKGITFGAAVAEVLLSSDPAYAQAVAANFNSLTPENEMKLAFIHPTQDTWNFGPADTLVDFAQAHDMSVRGQTLVWGQQYGDGVPEWLRAIQDPAQFQAAMIDSINTTLAHFKGRVFRWDVVNEPFVYGSAEIDRNVFVERLGIEYIDIAFRAAHEADPQASLWLNEAFTEYQPARAEALYNLVKSLVDKGVPIDGVGLQTHLIIDSPVAAGSVESMVERLRGLGVQVALTEIDVPTGPTRDEAAQVALYTQVIGECLHAGCTDIATWGIGDPNTWLDTPQLRAANVLLAPFANPSNPLLLDANYKPKPAYEAVKELITDL